MSGGTFECPNCGAAVCAGKKVCRECGSDDSTGWLPSDEIDYQSIDIPDGYGPDDELGPRPRRARMVAAVTLLMLVLAVVFALRFFR